MGRSKRKKFIGQKKIDLHETIEPCKIPDAATPEFIEEMCRGLMFVYESYCKYPNDFTRDFLLTTMRIKSDTNRRFERAFVMGMEVAFEAFWENPHTAKLVQRSDIIPGKERMVLYARVSTAEEAGLQRTDSQDDELNGYAIRNGHIIIGEAQDFESGKDIDRPAFQALMEMIFAAERDGRPKPFDGIIMLRIDRYMRDLEYGAMAIKIFREHKVKLLFAKDDIDVNSEGGFVIFAVLSSLSEKERVKIVSRVREGIVAYRSRNGGQWGRHARDDVNVNYAVALLTTKDDTTGRYRSLRAVSAMLHIPKSTIIDHIKSEGIDLKELRKGDES